MKKAETRHDTIQMKKNENENVAMASVISPQLGAPPARGWGWGGQRLPWRPIYSCRVCIFSRPSCRRIPRCRFPENKSTSLSQLHIPLFFFLFEGADVEFRSKKSIRTAFSASVSPVLTQLLRFFFQDKKRIRNKRRAIAALTRGRWALRSCCRWRVVGRPWRTRAAPRRLLLVPPVPKDKKRRFQNVIHCQKETRRETDSRGRKSKRNAVDQLPESFGLFCFYFGAENPVGTTKNPVKSDKVG